MEKERLVNFIAYVMEESGFEIHKNYQAHNKIIDIYGVLETSVGEVGVVVGCKNYEEPWKIGLDVLKDLEVAARTVHASKIVVFSTSSYTHSAAVYAQKRNIKLVDRKGLIKIAKNYAEKQDIVSEPEEVEERYIEDDDKVDVIDFEEEYKPTERVVVTYDNNNGSSPARLFSRGNSRNNNRSRGSNLSLRGTNPSNYNNTTSHRRSVSVNFNLNNVFEFFKAHFLIYMILLIVITSIVSYLFNIITSGPYTGLGKIISSAIISYLGILLVDKNLSDVLSRGSILFFISIIISTLMLGA